MTESSFSAYAPAVPGNRPWACTPGQRLMRRLPLHGNLLLLWLSLWLPAVPAALLLGLPWLPQGVLWKALPGPELALAVLVLGWVVSSYLLLCAGRLLSEVEQRRQRVPVAAQDAAAAPGLQPAVSVEAAALPAAEGAAIEAAQRTELQQSEPAPQHGEPQLQHGGPALQACEPALRHVATAPQNCEPAPLAEPVATLADTRVALQLHQQEIGAAAGELARRTVALCGLLDAGLRDAESAQADLEAIQDEERGALQLMAALRARLLDLLQHCHALAEGARAAQPASSRDGVDALAQAAAVELAQCHQLSERVGGAERLNERRIESMRRSIERLLWRAERGMQEGQQIMLLTRQVQAAQGASVQRLAALPS